MQFTLNNLRGALRNRLLNADSREIPDRELDDYLARGWEWTSSELGLTVTTDTATLALTADTTEYLLPADLLVVLWVEWNEIRLKPMATFEWDRMGNDWRNGPSTTPREFALEGRHLILYPPPDADAITADSIATVRYYAAPAALSVSGSAAGVLGEGDQMLVVYHAAQEWAQLHSGDPDKGRVWQGVAASNKSLRDELLTQALRRMMQRAADLYPGFGVTNRRAGMAR